MEFVGKLSEARRRLIWRQFFGNAFWVLLAGLGIFFLGRIFHIRWEWILAAGLGLPLGVSVIAALLRWKNPAAVAVELDRCANAKDRFVSALVLRRREGGLAGSALREINGYASRLRVADIIRPGFSRTWLWLLLPAAAIFFLEFWQARRAEALRPELAEAQKMVEQARELIGREAAKDPEIEEIARELQAALQQIQASSHPVKDALKALSEAERKLEAGRSFDAAEAGALAAELADSHPRMAENLRAGRNEEAAREIGKVDPQELARALKQAAEHLKNARLRSLSQAGAGEMQRQAAAFLQGGGEQSRRKLLSGLADMKAGRMAGKAEEGTEGQTPRESSEDGKNSRESRDKLADNAPSGAPGSEKDSGRGPDVSGLRERRGTGAGRDELLTGAAGEGETTTQIFQFTGNQNAEARRAFRSAYEKAAPAQLDAIEQENIPVGSRIMVRDYFEAIRPKE